MDKNTIYGFLLIAAILIGFSVLNKPSQKELDRQKAYNDSIALVQQQQEQAAKSIQAVQPQVKDTTANSIDAKGEFKASAVGADTSFVLENDVIKMKVSAKGGRISSVIVKGYATHDSLPLELFNAEESNYGFTLSTLSNRVINTSDLYFTPVGNVVKDSQGRQTLTMRLQAEGQSSLDFVYTLTPASYMVDYQIVSNGMDKVIPISDNTLTMNWNIRIRQQEKGRKFENQYSGIHYKYVSDNVEKLSPAKDDAKELNNKVKWVAFKDQFFSSVLIADDAFTGADLKSKMEPEESNYLKSYESTLSVPYDITGKKPVALKFYFGPNKYSILSACEKGLKGDDKLQLTQLIPLGWGIFGWVNRFAIIPMFNLFSSFIGNFGVIILLMTLVIKLVLSPLTYKSYISSAKMKVLKPEIDEINARIPADKPAERQKATMELYNKVGVSPFSGCLPTLLQMPILFAMFSFFPASIELRGESFLWAKDLSSYDAIVSWQTYVPLVSTYFGNHISLFTLLMTATTLVYTKLNMANTATPDQPGAGMIKWMMYLMPIMFMFMFNNYASGLSYYYFISTLISILQTYAIRATVNDKKLLAQLHAKRATNAKKPVKKNSFLERLEKMQHEQQKQLQQNRKK